MNITIGQLIVWIIMGALAGYVAGQLFRGRAFGGVGNVVIGLLGALLGGLIFQVLNIRLTGLPVFTFSLADLLVAIVGALVLLLIVRAVSRR